MDILVKFNDYFSVLQLYNFTTNGRKGRQGSIQMLRVPTTARYLINAWGLVEEHITLIMDIILELSTAAGGHSRRGYSD